MNWSGLSVAIGLIGLGAFTLPYGLIVFAFLAYLLWVS